MAATKLTDLTQIVFPVFRLGDEKPITLEGVTLYYRQYLEEDDNIKEVYRIVDDKNVEGATLSIRRLKLLQDGVKLKKLNRAMFFLSDFIKLSNPQSWFIDSEGTIFQHKKSKSLKLIFKKIKRIIRIPTGGVLLEVDGIPGRFKTLYTPPPTNKYAGMLVNGMGYILYGTYETELKPTRRMI